MAAQPVSLRSVAVIDAEDATAVVIRHDARDLPLDDGTVDLVVTSPPYFALRSYRDDGEHYGGQIGSEDTPDLFLDALDECMVEWGRVLKPSGSVWVNLGDKYASHPAGNANPSGFQQESKSADQLATYGYPKGLGATPYGVPRKSLMGLPWRFAIRQIDAGWILRAEVVWDKPNGLPESVTDRVRRSHEQWFHFVKEPRYFAGVDEIREPSTTAATDKRSDPGRYESITGSWHDHSNDLEAGNNQGVNEVTYNPLGRLPGSVWTIPSEPLLIPDETREALDLPDHFAAFPQEWPRRIILGWSPTGICTVCGEGRRPVVIKELVDIWHDKAPQQTRYEDSQDEHLNNRKKPSDSLMSTFGSTAAVIDSYFCACPTPDAPTTPAVILDPFGGTGTVAGVARTLGRYGISNDLSESYNRLATWRIWQSGHFAKTEQRTWADRQTSLL